MAMPRTRFNALVSSVIDGDTFRTRGPHEDIRLARVYAPELGAPGGENAKRILSNKILNRVVTIDPVGTSYQRTVAEVWVDGENVNDFMRRQGYK